MSEGGTEALREQCIILAGALAEAGVQGLTLVMPDGTRERLPARETDLPGRLLGAPVGTRVEAASIGLCVERGAGGLGVVAATTARGVEIAERLGAWRAG